MGSSSLAHLYEKEAKLHRMEWGSKAKMEDGGGGNDEIQNMLHQTSHTTIASGFL